MPANTAQISELRCQLITELFLKNFRSIGEASIEFPVSGLAVLIGANGSGKTNIVKAIEFISNLHKHGMEYAVKQAGYREGLYPKHSPTAEIKNSPSFMRYTISLPPLEYKDGSSLAVSVSHQFSIIWAGPKKYKIINESLVFTDPYRVASFLANKGEKGIDDSIPSRLELFREGNDINLIVSPSLDDNVARVLASWFRDPIKSVVQDSDYPVNTFRALFETYPKKGTSSKSIVEDDFGLILNFILQFTTFANYAEMIKRFDFQLQELRAEQLATEEVGLDTSGGNLPSAMRSLKSKSKEDRFAAILKTLRRISPHVIDAKVRQFSSGKEFVSFMESSSGRSVESWHSSDGTLRALAILLAIESADNHQIIIVEEPEQNLHPWAMEAMIGHIRGALVRKKGMQVLLTTHSADILNCVDSDEVFVVTRDRATGSTVSMVDDLVPTGNDIKGDIGRLWSSGLLSGVPSGGWDDQV